jgi:Ran GTPase-activating protein (RanGAP) involved in mRNA processing and transport
MPNQNFESIMERLYNNDLTLTSLCLSAQALPDEDTTTYEDIITLSEALAENKILQSLDLHYNQISDSGAKSLSDALKINRTLKTLDIGDNQITAAGAQYFSDALKANQTLQSLTLRTNSIGDAGARYLGEALKINQTLQILNVGDNQITATGAKYLSDALKANQTLQLLTLWTNPIGDTGSKYLGEALKINQTLQTLNVGDNQITATGAKYLSDALKANRTLQSLILWTNLISDTGAKHLGEALKANRTLQALDLEDNRISDAGVKDLAKSLKINKTLQSLDVKDNQIGAVDRRIIDIILEKHRNQLILRSQDGDVHAQVGLGYCYETGYGMQESKLKALEWYLKAAPQSKQARLAVKRLSNINSNKLKSEYEIKAKTNDVSAMSTLGLIYQYCQLTDKNGNLLPKEDHIKKAQYWYEKAEKFNDALAMNQLGLMYKNRSLGQKMSENDRHILSVQFFNRAVLAGCVEAHKSLSMIFEGTWNTLLHRIKHNDAKLTSLDLSHWPLTDDHVYLLCQALRKNKKLKTVDLRHNKLTIKGVYYLTSLLTKNKTIERVEVSDNPLLNDEAHRIINGVLDPVFKHRRGEDIELEEVNLQGCQPAMIRDVFLPNLKYYHKLLALNLSHLEQEHDFFFPFLAQEYLKKNPILLSLNLSYNHLKFDSLFKIASTMNKNHTLMDLDVSHNEVDLTRTGIDNLYKQFKRNPKLANIDITANFLDEDADEALLAAPSTANAPASLFYSQHYRRGELKIPSLLRPDCMLSNKNTDTWIVALACHKGAEHSVIFIERLRSSGQHELLRCHIQTDGTFTGQTNTLIEHNWYHFNPESWYMDIHEVDSGTGEALLYSIRKELYEHRNYTLLPGWATDATTNISKAKRVNCATWCIEHLKEVGIDVQEGAIPSLIAQPEKNQRSSSWFSSITKAIFKLA